MKRFFILHFRDVLCFNLQYVPVRMCMWLVAVGVPSGCRRPHNDVKSLFLQYVMQTCFSPYSLISLGRWEGTCFWAEVFWTEISQGKACKCKALLFQIVTLSYGKSVQLLRLFFMWMAVFYAGKRRLLPSVWRCGVMCFSCFRLLKDRLSQGERLRFRL